MNHSEARTGISPIDAATAARRPIYVRCFEPFLVLLVLVAAGMTVYGLTHDDRLRTAVLRAAAITLLLLAAYGGCALLIAWVQGERMVGWFRRIWPMPVPGEIAAPLDQLPDDRGADPRRTPDVSGEPLGPRR